MSGELEQQLFAFGRTLEVNAAEPIRRAEVALADVPSEVFPELGRDPELTTHGHGHPDLAMLPLPVDGDDAVPRGWSRIVPIAAAAFVVVGLGGLWVVANRDNGPTPAPAVEPSPPTQPSATPTSLEATTPIEGDQFATTVAPQTTHYVLPPLVPPAREADPIVFSGEVSPQSGVALQDERATVRLTPGPNGDEVCFSIALLEESHQGCVAVQDLRSGLTVVASQAHGGLVDVIGLVPDDVATVHIAGHVIEVRNNVWHFAGETGQDLTFEVRSADGSTVASRD